MAYIRNTSVIEFDRPASDWNEALPIGNGRQGAMVFGGVGTELLQLNEDSIWYGGPKDRINPDAKKSLQLIRKALDEGRISDAQESCALSLSGLPETMSHYEALGNLYILMDGDEEGVSDYRRELDLRDAIVRVGYKKDGVEYSREIFASYPDQVIAVRLKADHPSISFRTQIARGNITWDLRPYSQQIYRNPNYNSFVDSVNNVSSNMTLMTGTAGGRGGVTFAGAVKVASCDGDVRGIGNSIVVSGASEAVILVSSVSSFYVEDPEKHVIEVIGKAPSYDELKSSHIADYKSLYDRVSLTLPEDQGDVVRMFNFARFLTIEGSREGSQPLNLQGIWNKDFDPMWGSKFTININTEMNYWPCEAMGLPECHEPLFDLIDRMYPRGREAASRMYGMSGFVAHHNTDIHGDCAPQDVCLSSSYWIMGAAWLCLHIMEHYRFTKDKEFLKKHYGEIEDSCRFLLDYVTEDNGYLVTSPTISPENEYRLPTGEHGCVCKGCAMDDQIMTELFKGFIEMSDELSVSSELLGKVKDALPRITPVRIDSTGRIMEWHEEYEEIDPGHRHISHLFGLYPGHTIDTPELKDAARKTLERRLEGGGGHTGWSRAWIVNLYGALGDGDEALSQIRLLMEKSLLPNLLDNHPPFQIDGNFGLAAGIINLIVTPEGDMLPALPSAWKSSGSLKGIRVHGDRSLSFSWKDGVVIKSEYYAN